MIYVVSCDTAFCKICMDVFGIGKHISVQTSEQLRFFAEVKPTDIALLDLKFLPKTDLSFFRCPVIMLVPAPNMQEAAGLLKQGVKGYGNRMMHPDNLKSMVTTVKAGQLWLPPEILAGIIGLLPSKIAAAQDIRSKISDREAEVACLIADGKTNHEIADELSISLRTVKAHLTSIFQKTGLRDRMALAINFKNHR